MGEEKMNVLAKCDLGERTVTSFIHLPLFSIFPVSMPITHWQERVLTRLSALLVLLVHLSYSGGRCSSKWSISLGVL